MGTINERNKDFVNGTLRRCGRDSKFTSSELQHTLSNRPGLLLNDDWHKAIGYFMAAATHSNGRANTIDSQQHMGKLRLCGCLQTMRTFPQSSSKWHKPMRKNPKRTKPHFKRWYLPQKLCYLDFVSKPSHKALYLIKVELISRLPTLMLTRIKLCMHAVCSHSSVLSPAR